ncbi:hypothetical protein LXL04_005598 [Taraxacum kok-saghyz]
MKANIAGWMYLDIVSPVERSGFRSWLRWGFSWWGLLSGLKPTMETCIAQNPIITGFPKAPKLPVNDRLKNQPFLGTPSPMIHEIQEATHVGNSRQHDSGPGADPRSDLGGKHVVRIFNFTADPTCNGLDGDTPLRERLGGRDFALGSPPYETQHFGGDLFTPSDKRRRPVIGAFVNQLPHRFHLAKLHINIFQVQWKPQIIQYHPTTQVQTISEEITTASSTIQFTIKEFQCFGHALSPAPFPRNPWEEGKLKCASDKCIRVVYSCRVSHNLVYSCLKLPGLAVKKASATSADA